MTSTQPQTRVEAKDLSTLSMGARAEKAGPMQVVAGLGNVTVGNVLVGSSATQELQFYITGLALTTPTPRCILLQPRQSDNRNLNNPDEFALQVIETHADSILVRVRRLDQNAGWAQKLRVDFFIVD
jgi:hypothetical protein